MIVDQVYGDAVFTFALIFADDFCMVIIIKR